MSAARPLPWRRALAVVVVGVAAGAVLAPHYRNFVAAHADEAEAVVKAPSRVFVRKGIVTLVLDEAAQRKSGIATAAAPPPLAEESLSAYGAVLDAAPLIELNGRYLEAGAQLKMAQAKLAVTRTAYERAKTLYKDRQNVSAAQMQTAEGDFEAAGAELAAARARLAAVTATVAQSWGPVLGEALIDGGPLIQDLIQRRVFLVKATLPPGASLAHPPVAASAELPGGKKIRLDFVSAATAADPRLQGEAFFYRTPAGDGALPGLNLIVSLPRAGGVQGAVAPESAVVWLHGKAWLYLRVKPDAFIRREIAPLRAAPHGGYLVAGLKPGAQIVVIGAQMLLSEEFRAEATAGDED
ncbi:efflux RND transporter periplasmic adaptor subunit [Rhodoblastus acidophilus]|uniref:Efflux RND transporter periplasmic adaptor subunit n=1 Tax=Candidatus Rhodoblastus alkanivorans TaxID=2954117 RepID=A0ABS9Z386_9HYPH|nr:efflux RND transporter periplasmic adaptor subunit [Candidatus Rhodoblastus alkanivorans]MCI4677399.1 efflux RND transporter periplasmic adaptor subunit [Candidatus Rhodoblastus alkanivorans]MCI4682134.1 efflux RND transporter periplasmic adaptor subunit [Candidatus Rhodoblastus alkanivorans]MDI4639436.1 efflux RND transporter periplasmic adaptor subunit [Rhodoblastus acidophilus]